MKFPALLLTTAILVSCSTSTPLPPSPPPPTSSHFTASDGKNLSLRHWNHQQNPQTIIIALHGIAGAARDFQHLGESLPSHTTLYAPNLRGLGYDPTPKNRGDIRSPSLWFRDLSELHLTLHHRHPHARIAWLGESMGALIALHTATKTPVAPDALILSSPVTSLSSLPSTRRHLLILAARLAPTHRLSLESLAGSSFTATSNSNHFEQSSHNPWHIDAYTLRFLATLGSLTEQMPRQARLFHNPTLILSGQKDGLVPEKSLARFVEQFPHKPESIRFNNSHHLLFYDSDYKLVTRSLINWLEKTL